jgi:Ca2+/Na+ antiporter
VLALLVLLAVLLSGCGDDRGANRGGADQTEVGETLVSIGLLFTWAGSAAIGLGVLGLVACLVFPAIAAFREFLGDIAVVGLASLLLGTSFIWLGNHPWVLAVAVGLLAAFLGYRYWPRLVRALRRRKEAVKP